MNTLTSPGGNAKSSAPRDRSIPGARLSRRLVLRRFGQAGLLGSAGLLAGCASAPPQRSGALSDYAGLSASKGILTATEVRIDASAVLAARTVAILPTRLSHPTTEPGLSSKQKALVANAIDRALCSGLAERFTIVAPGARPDLTVRATVSKIVPTNAVMAGVSRAASLGASFALPVPVPRLPIGLGGLGVEAEALDAAGRQRAAQLWSRDADMVTSRPRVSEIGDAYHLAASFGEDFARLLTTGADPMKGGPSIPSFRDISAGVTGQPKQQACAAFGVGPGMVGMVAAAIGTPPEWGDQGAEPSSEASATPERSLPSPTAPRASYPAGSSRR